MLLKLVIFVSFVLLQSAATSLLSIHDKKSVESSQNPKRKYVQLWETYRSNATMILSSKLDEVFSLVRFDGRLGNHFAAIKHALRYAICCGGKLHIVKPHPEFPFMARFMDFSSRFSEYKSLCGKGFAGNFWDNKPFNPPRRCMYDEFGALQYLMYGTAHSRASRPEAAPLPGMSCDPQLEKALVVHLRSGDIFRKDRPNPNYGQPPLFFYYKVFTQRQWERIHLITGPTATTLQNPIYTYVRNMKSTAPTVFSAAVKTTKITFQRSYNLTQDWHTMMCASFFVSSRSTLSQMILDTSPYLRETFTVGNCDQFSSSVKCQQIPLPGYKFKNWTNSAHDRRNMFNYGFQGSPFPTLEFSCILFSSSSKIEMAPSKDSSLSPFIMVILFVIWYSFNAGYNVYNATLKVFPLPITIAALQLLVGLFYVLPLWILGFRKVPNLSFGDIITLLPIALLNAAGHGGAVIAMFQVGGGSFTHVIKASEPVVSVILGLLINGVVPKPFTALSLLPITYGVAYASTLGNLSVSTMSRELTTKAAIFATVSNVAFALRSILRKNLSAEFKARTNLDSANDNAVTTILSALLTIPAAIYLEKTDVILNLYQSLPDQQSFHVNLFICGMCFYIYNEVQNIVLGSLGAVPTAVGNTLKRVVIFVALYFFTEGETFPVPKIVGCAIAIAGCLAFAIFDSKKI